MPAYADRFSIDNDYGQCSTAKTPAKEIVINRASVENPLSNELIDQNLYKLTQLRLITLFFLTA